jgi:hypothetical protein
MTQLCKEISTKGLNPEEDHLYTSSDSDGVHVQKPVVKPDIAKARQAIS